MSTPTLPSVLASRGHSYIAFAAGRKYLHAVAMGNPIAIVTLPLHSAPSLVHLKGKPYPVRRAARIYLKSQIALSDGAKRVLRALARGETEVPVQ